METATDHIIHKSGITLDDYRRMSGRPLRWQGVLIDTPDVKTTAEMIEKAGLDWEVELFPVQTTIDFEGHPYVKEMPERRSVVRMDTLDILGDVGKGWTPLQNRKGFELADDIIGESDAHWLGGGSTKGGARVHALMRMGEGIKIGGLEDENVIPLLKWSNGHDGGLGVTYSTFGLRAVCLNGLMLEVESMSRVWKARHTKNVDMRLLEVRRVLDITFAYFEKFESIGNELVEAHISDEEFERFLASLVPMPKRTGEEKDERKFTNVDIKREGIAAVYKNADNLNNIRGTKWGVLNAVAEFEDHMSRTRRVRGRDEEELRFERATEPNALKDRALVLLRA